jgi:hypothetical protein
MDRLAQTDSDLAGYLQIEIVTVNRTEIHDFMLYARRRPWVLTWSIRKLGLPRGSRGDASGGARRGVR